MHQALHLFWLCAIQWPSFLEIDIISLPVIKSITHIFTNLAVFSDNTHNKDKIALKNFELLKVLGTGGKSRISLTLYIKILVLFWGKISFSTSEPKINGLRHNKTLKPYTRQIYPPK